MSIINTALIGKLKKLKADKSNVLELDNTSAFTPSLDYHPSTKKYVDDAIVSVGGSDTYVTSGSIAGTDLILTLNDSSTVTVDVSNLSTGAGGSLYLNNRQAQDFTATSGQTIFNVSIGLNDIEVFYNGIKLDNEDFTIDSGAGTLTLLEAAEANDNIEIINFGNNVELNHAYNKYSYTVGTASGNYTGSTTSFPALIHDGLFDVWLNGLKLTGDEYTSTTTAVDLATAADSGDYIEIISYIPLNVNNFYTKNEVDTIITNIDALPDQTGQSGNYLTTDGTTASWNTITQYTPPTDQGAGNFLAGDGTYKAIDVSGDIAAAVSNLVDSAPTTLDTLNELAAALGDDPNFATTITTQIGTKQDTLVSGTNIKTVGGETLLGSGDISLVVDWNDITNIPDNILNKETFTATAGQDTFSINYTVGAIDVYFNGIRLTEGTDYTATNGTSIVLTDPAAAGDIIDLVALSAVNTYINDNIYTKTETDSLLSAKQDTLASTTGIALNGNSLDYTDTDGNVTNIDLSSYLDNTNTYVSSGSVSGTTLTLTLSDASTVNIDVSSLLDDTTNTISSGTLSGNNIIFTREDSSTFSVDVTNLYDDTNLVTSVAGRTGAVTLTKSDITDFSDADYATAAQGSTADTAVQPGDNISTLTNDSGYITSSSLPTNVSELNNDADYATKGTSIALAIALG
jgi:hypothetical protein